MYDIINNCKLDDIIDAFVKVANKYVDARCVRGFIKLSKISKNY
jgi:hypothetical protein